MDGSHHDWLEGRGPELVFMGYIDDATNTVYGGFYDYEGTLQDRLVKEMRLRGIKTKEESNLFLKEYLPVHNKKFQVCASNETDVHARLPRSFDLNQYLCVKTERTVRNDNTIAHNSKLYQIESPARTKKMAVEERVDGTMRLRSGGVFLNCREITERPERMPHPTAKRPKTRKPNIPPKDHPWRTQFKPHRHPLRDAYGAILQ